MKKSILEKDVAMKVISTSNVDMEKNVATLKAEKGFSVKSNVKFHLYAIRKTAESTRTADSFN